MNILYLLLIGVIHKSLINPEDLTLCNQYIHCNDSVTVDLNWFTYIYSSFMLINMTYPIVLITDHTNN